MTFLYDNRELIYHPEQQREAAFQQKRDSEKDLLPNVKRLFF
ncbi:MAG: hypothetical protein PVS3B3_38650 [Ktedonobacteraceae bacterium]